MRPLRLPIAPARRLMDSPSGSAWLLILRVRRGRDVTSGAPIVVRRDRRARSLVPPALLPGCSPNGRRWDLSGFPVTRPAPLPCSKTPAGSVVLAIADFPTPPPPMTRRRHRRLLHFVATTRLQHPLSTLHELRRRSPCKTRFWLAGSASTRGDSNPLGHDERFQVIPSSSPGLGLTLDILQYSAMVRSRAPRPFASKDPRHAKTHQPPS